MDSEEVWGEGGGGGRGGGERGAKERGPRIRERGRLEEEKGEGSIDWGSSAESQPFFFFFFRGIFFFFVLGYVGLGLFRVLAFGSPTGQHAARAKFLSLD